MKRRVVLFLLALVLAGPVVPTRSTLGQDPRARLEQRELQVRLLEAVEYLLQEVERHAQE